MSRLFFQSFVLLGLFATIVGCSGRETTVVVDERSEAEQQAAYDDYDKQMAEEAANYK